MPKSVSTRSAYKMLTCIYLCRTLLFFAPYADFLHKACESAPQRPTKKMRAQVQFFTLSAASLRQITHEMRLPIFNEGR